MTNEMRYKTTQERAEAFEKFCEGKNFKNLNRKSISDYVFAWLDLEAKVDKPLPCPCCGGDAEVYYIDEVAQELGEANVQCKHCFLMTPDCDSDTEAIRRWNARVAGK